MYRLPRFFPALTAAAAVACAAAAAPATGPTTAPTSPPPPPPLFADGRVVTLPRVSVEVVGHGPDVVLIPGLSCSKAVWQRTAERLRATHRLHVVQVAGFAGEPPQANAVGPVFEPTVDAIHQYLIDAKLGPVAVIGHSLGGTMALRLAQLHPADVSQVMLVDALPFYGVLMGGPTATVAQVAPVADAFRKQMGRSTPAQSRAAIAGMVTAPADADRIAAWSAASDRGVVGQAVYDDVTTDLRPGLPTMTVPVTLIYPFEPAGPVPLANWDGLYQGQFAAVPHKTLVRIDGSRHFIMCDQPAKFDAAVDAFLAGRSAPTPRG